ncbi:MAG: S41 family peptidase [Neisseriaceae bacterium]|nr:S41 family peptidase [Neisseriaceae bacterium]
MSKKGTIKKLSLCILCALAGAMSAISVQSFADNQKDALPVQEIRNFVEVYGQIKANYYQDTKDDKLIKEAVKGMVSGLDPHSEYLTAKDYEDLKEHTAGEFGGLGMEIGKRNDSIVIIAPIEDTPAERAGVKSGDYILKINDESTRGMSTSAAVKLMRGKPGTPIDLTLSRKDSSTPIQVHIIRDVIKVKSVRSKLLEDGIGYVKVSNFQERTTEDLVSHINELVKKNKTPLKGLVLDLRDDPGGLLHQAVGVSAVFLPQGKVVVSTKGRDGRNTVSYKAEKKDYMPGKRLVGKDPLSNLPAYIKDIPVTVLINSGSASASEIVAGALQDHKRAVMVGVQSFGKGSVQTVIPLSNGSGVKLTVSLYYTPNDRSIQANGVVPDVEVKGEYDDYQMREADLSGHLNNPKGDKETKGKIDEDAAAKRKEVVEKNKAKSEDEKFDDLLSRREPDPTKDEQLKKALDLLKDSTLYQQSIGLAAKEKRDTKKVVNDEHNAEN